MKGFYHICYLLFLWLALLGCSPSDRNYLAVCAIFKNEAPWLKEWLTYHHKVLGVGHFYLYNNGSTDNYLAVLEPFLADGVVELIDWDGDDPEHLTYGAFMDAPWSGAQLGAYNDCLKHRAFGKSKWVAMIDIDEFIVPVHGVRSFYSILKKAEKNKKGTVSFYWRVFGTSGVNDLDKKELLTEKLVMRSKDDHPWNLLVKSIHRPEAVDFCLVHIADRLYPSFGARTIAPDKVRIHHYWSRTEKFCSEKRKIPQENNDTLDALNQYEDTTILQYLPLFKEDFR